MTEQFTGAGVALATPLKKDLSVDLPALQRLVDHALAGGIDYLVVMGTTGESPTFSWKEKLDILSFITGISNDRAPVVFGLGGNNTFDLIEKSKELASVGVEAVLSVNPYYNKPSQEGIIRHYTLLADACPKPLILYNVPARTASNMTAETTLRLSAHENIIGMKEASGDLEQISTILDHRPDDFLVLSGDDPLTLEMIRRGADGVISVIANVLPGPFTEMVNLALKGAFEEAQKKDELLKKCYELLAKEGNPSSLKAGLEVLNLAERTVRPPLFEGSDQLMAEWRSYLD